MIQSDQIRTIVENIWSSVLGLEVAGAEPVDAVQGEYLTSCVHITGAFDGALTIACPVDSARKGAATMFGMELKDVGDSEMQDALGELANIAGGNVKSLLPPGCMLSLPTVVQGHDHKFVVPNSKVMTETAFNSEGKTLVVKVLERERQS
jgi:chemotaxis protein CheX